MRLGIPDKFGEVATEKYLYEKHGFGPDHIVQACKSIENKRL
jgi:transketolase C-terminal domain/subunit